MNIYGIFFNTLPSRERRTTVAACLFKRDCSSKVLVMASVVDKKPQLTGYQKVSGSDEAAATVVITSGSDNSHTPTHCSYSLHHGSTSQ